MTTLTDTQVITASGGLVELGYSQITTGVTVDNATAGTGKEVIAPLTVVCDGGPVLIEFFSPDSRASSTAGDVLYVSLFQDGSETIRRWGSFVNASAGSFDYKPLELKARLTPTAGSHTFSVRAYVTNASRTGFINAGTSGTDVAPAFLRVSKIVQATQWPAVTTGTIICTSSTRPASPFEGQTIYETDTDTKYLWSGSSWVVATPGMVLLNATDVAAGTSSVNVDNVFSSQYRNYCIQFVGKGTSTGPADLQLGLRTTTDNTASYIRVGTYNNNTGGPNRTYTNGASSFIVGFIADFGRSAARINVNEPNVAVQTTILAQGSGWGTAASASGTFEGMHDNTTQFTGFRLFPSSGTFSGRILTYGLVS